jgi:hypothetical protein
MHRKLTRHRIIKWHIFLISKSRHEHLTSLGTKRRKSPFLALFGSVPKDGDTRFHLKFPTSVYVKSATACIAVGFQNRPFCFIASQ